MSKPTFNNKSWTCGNERKYNNNEKETEAWNHKIILGHATNISPQIVETNTPVTNINHLTKHNALFKHNVSTK